MAMEEVIEGQTLTQSEKLNQTLKEVENHLQKERYDEIINEASEYIYQENYEDAIKKLNSAIVLLPEEENAYNRLAELYILTGKYDQAVRLLEDALKHIGSNTLEEILDRATTLRDEKKERLRILKQLNEAVSVADAEKIQELLKNTFFTMKIAGSDPVYYSTLGEGRITNGNGLLVIDANTVYSGGFQDGLKKGAGVLFVQKEGKENSGWYCYQGEWSKDLPNGMGKLTDISAETDDQGVIRQRQVITEGIFYNGTEDDNMKKTFYLDGKEEGSIRYQSKSGIPLQYLDKDGLSAKSEDPDRYIIAKWYRQGEPTDEYYTVRNNTLWGVELYLRKRG